MLSTNNLDIPNDASVVLLGSDSTECVLIERKLKNLGLKSIRRHDRGAAVLTLCQEHMGDIEQALISYRVASLLAPSYARAKAKIEELEARVNSKAS